MRFDKLNRTQANTEITPRRVTAARQRIAKEKAGWGMFADQMTFETVEDRLDRINNNRVVWLRSFRQHRADNWKQVRRLLRTVPPDKRRQIIAEWNETPYPGSPEYVLEFLRAKGIFER